MTAVLEPTDQAARERIRTDHEATLFVEAGAGTGKTTALVRRVAELVVTGKVADARQLAAITFTEAAAAELRDRVREQLEGEVGRIERTDEERARVESVLADVDEITLTTLHGFASRLLGEFPLEAGLPPGFEVEDEIEASVRFDRRFRDLVDDLHQDPELRPVWARALALRLPLNRLAEVADIYDDNWDRLGPGGVDRTLTPVTIDGVVGPLAEAVALAGNCIDPEDNLLTHVDDVAAPMERELRALAALGDADTLLTALVRSEKLSCSGGKQGSWNDAKPEVVAALAAAEEERTRLVHDHRTEVLTILADRLRSFAVEGAQERRRRGQVSYHDLLVHARDLLRSDADVRTKLARQYRYLLIDEFQDTDPLQIEIAALLAAAHPEAEPGHWTEIDVVPGKLFFVGDPKQSIYRFRRADIALYGQAKEAFAAAPVRLTANFRSVPDVLAWVNRVFGEMIVEDGDVQPPYVDLDPHRDAPGARPAVLVVGGPVEGKSIGEVRDGEAQELAELVQRMRAESWEIGREERRPLRYDDVALLVPTRTPLGQIERAFERQGVPYRIESRSLIFQTDEVRELLAILAAVDDPADEVAVVAALRSPGLACSDRDLVDWRLGGGTWDPLRDPPEELATHPVAVALGDLRRLHQQRDTLPVNDLVARVVRERRLAELTLARRRPRDHWRRYRFLTDTARAFVEAGGTSLAEFVAWATAQADGRADRVETVAREADDDAVRIMTVHGSKGLEFPVVVLAGLNADRDVRPPLVSWGDAGPEIRFGNKSQGGYFETANYATVRESDERFEEAEQRRLLYVAATRAQDHLVVSLHHKPAPRVPSFAQMLYGVCESCHELHTRPEAAQLALDVSLPRPEEPPEAPDAAARWKADRQALLERVRVASVASPSRLAHEDEPAEEDQRVPGRGTGGTARGRAVHAVLEAVHLPDAEDLDELAELWAAQEGLVGRAAEVARVARAALAAPVVQRALAAPRHWRELAVVAEVDGRLVEGFIDLAFEDDDGRLVVVDHKTDAVSDPADLDLVAAGYRLQVAAYAATLSAATGKEVSEGWLVFAGPDGAHERQVDLTTARAELPAALRG